MNWITSKFHLSNNLLKKLKLLKIRFSLKANLIFFSKVSKLAYLVQEFKTFRNWFRLWNHLECFILWIACRKNSNVSKAMQYMEGIEIFQCPKAQNGCWKNSKFSRTESVKKIKWNNWKFHRSNSLLEKRKLLQTDLNYEMNWSPSKLQCSNRLLEKLNFFSQTDPVFEMNWIISKLQSWKGLFEKLNFLANWSSLVLLDLIEILQSFINQITCSKKHRLFKVWFNF